MKKLAFIAAGLLLCCAARAQELPKSPAPMPAFPAVPEPRPLLPALLCNPHGDGVMHPVCFWQEPDAHDCFTGVGKEAYPARHYFSGKTVCWPGDQHFFSTTEQ